MHFPFCKQKCYYCDFNSYSGLEELIPAYGESLIGEMRRFLPQESPVRSVYFGGGTPSYFPVELLLLILQFIKENFAVVPDAEITLEANPGTVKAESLKALKTGGFNRLSLGLQAVQDRLLRSIGRIHSWPEFLESYRQARTAGFTNIGVDLIFGLPGQTIGDWRESLAGVAAMGPEHISAYGLQLEPGTPLAGMVDRGLLELPPEDEVAFMMRYTMDFLNRNGYDHYEISNFAKPGFRSIHNLGYWTGRQYLGFGAGASSTYQRERWVNLKDPAGYIRAVKNNAPLKSSSEFIDQATAAVETLMLGLRMRSGINLQDFQEQFHIDLAQTAGPQLEKLLAQKLLTIINGRLALTAEGVLISNYIISCLLQNL